jgi:hypothetical protein
MTVLEPFCGIIIIDLLRRIAVSPTLARDLLIKG